MLRNNKGFTLIEMMVAVLIFTFVLLATTSVYIPLVGQFGQQTKISESQINSMVGLELLKSDVTNAGYGIFWSVLNNITLNYNEAVFDPAAANDSSGNVPRAIVLGNNLAAAVGIVPNTDYLVVKSASASNLCISTAKCGSTVVSNATSKKWTYINYPLGTAAASVNIWGTAEDMTDGVDNVITILPASSDGTTKNVLIVDGAGNFSTTFEDDGTFSSSFTPVYGQPPYILYGIDGNLNLAGKLRMPFNRADYYVSKRRCSVSTGTYCLKASDCPGGETCTPSYCADNTGVLVKAVISQANGSRDLDGDGVLDEMPILDCVADFQVALGLDTDGDGVAGTYTDLTNLTSNETGVSLGSVTASLTDPAQLRTQLKSVHIYILTHEGMKDKSFKYPSNTIAVGEALCEGGNCGGAVLGNSAYNLAAITNYQQYRWRVIKLTIRPISLNPK